MSFEIVHVKKIILTKKFLDTNIHLEITSIVVEFIAVLCLYNSADMMQSMNGIIC